jgi:threonine dehydrogenase-like Zn-dependent dehydrogenase
MGARVIALDINPQRLARATEFGADLVINPNETDAVEAIRNATRGLGADYTFDAAGGEKSRLAAASSTRTWGTLCVVGEGGDLVLDVSVDILRRQLTIIGSWTFSSLIQAECAQFVLDHGLSIDKQFTHRWKLNQAVEAYQLWDKQTEGKGVFLM